ncbi:MAG: S8 family peptidase [Alphaproteobacteria bacterium]|nr:S8 family peptidase [Alphaproteobacteria bacterium]
MLNRDPTGMELRADPTALAPERLLVFELRGSVANFAAAIRRVPGLELIDEEELDGDGAGDNPVAYLMVPDARALKDIEGLWRRWTDGRLLHGETPWRDVFSLLRVLRPWGPADRVHDDDNDILREEIVGRADDELVALEIELVFRDDERVANRREEDVRAAVMTRSGRIVSRSHIPDIAYHALLVQLPVRSVSEIIERSVSGIAGLEPVMSIRPQNLASTIELADPANIGPAVEVGWLGEPILALLDGVPVSRHPLLARHLSVDDPFGLEPTAMVAERRHGTAMASLIVHGDRNRAEQPLPRRIHVVPVLGAGDAFPDDRLIVDLVHTAITTLRDGRSPTAPSVLIVNLSLGDSRRPFHGRLSPWARLLDRLAYHHGILFLVSAGNVTKRFGVPAFTNRSAFEDATGTEKAEGTLRAVADLMGERRLFAPAETVNGVTVGACNDDAVPPGHRAVARANVDPYPDLSMANPSSSLGPGFASSVKPDILMPGAREHLRVVGNHTHIDVTPAGASRAAGLKVAAPPLDGREDVEGYTGATSAATALASRTCHRIHDALEAAYGDKFTALPHLHRAVLLKALLTHPARWPDDAAALIRSIVGPPDGRHHVRQKDNIRRFLGHGVVDGDEAIACAADRATFWATGTLEPNKIATISVPVPAAIGGQARPHSLSATLAWFTPVSPGRKSYRTIRMRLLEPSALETTLRVKAPANQPDGNQTRRGTLFKRRWSGDRAPIVGPDMSIPLIVQRDPDQGAVVDEAVPFGLAVTLTMPGMIELYEQVRQRLGIWPPVPA